MKGVNNMKLQGNSYQDFCSGAYKRDLEEAKRVAGYSVKHHELSADMTDQEILDWYRSNI